MATVGSCAISYDEAHVIRTVRWDWVADAAGAVSGFDTKQISGEIVRIVTNPGSPAPTDNYDILLNDPNGLDVANGTLANRDTVTTEQVVPIIETSIAANVYGSTVYLNDILSLVIANAGSGGAGALILYYRPEGGTPSRWA